MKMVYRFLVFGFLFTISILSVKAQKVKFVQSSVDIKGLDKAVTDLLQALNTKDKHKINTYIHPAIGLYIQYTIGASFNFSKLKQFEYGDNLHLSNIYNQFKFNKNKLFAYEPYPIWIVENICGLKLAIFTIPIINIYKHNTSF